MPHIIIIDEHELEQLRDVVNVVNDHAGEYTVNDSTLEFVNECETLLDEIDRERGLKP